MPPGRRRTPCRCRSSCTTRSSPTSPARTPSSRGSWNLTSGGWRKTATRPSSWRTLSPMCATVRRCRKSPSCSALTTGTTTTTSMCCRCCGNMRRASSFRCSGATRTISPSGRVRASTMRTSHGTSSTRCSPPVSSRCRTTPTTCTATRRSATAACRTRANRRRTTRSCCARTCSACRISSRSTPAAHRTPLPTPTANTATGRIRFCAAWVFRRRCRATGASTASRTTPRVCTGCGASAAHTGQPLSAALERAYKAAA